MQHEGRSLYKCHDCGMWIYKTEANKVLFFNESGRKFFIYLCSECRQERKEINKRKSTLEKITTQFESCVDFDYSIINRAILSLDESQATILNLYYGLDGEKISVRKIADMFGITTSRVYQKLKASKRNVRAKIKFEKNLAKTKL